MALETRGSTMRALKHNVPPYEVMKRLQPMQPGAEVSRRDESHEARNWWSQWRDPVMLRVPRIFVVLGMLGLVGLIILTYWVGITRGMSARPAAPVVPVESAPVTTLSRPLRVAGMNYLELVVYPKLPGAAEEAAQLLNFLESRGVAAIVEAGNNGGLKIVDLRPFTEADLRSQAYQTYVQQLQALGQEWKKAHNGTLDFRVRPEKFSPAAKP